jgi:hypothetical protein
MSLRVWRYPILRTYRSIGSRLFENTPHVEFVPASGGAGADYFGWPLSYDDFTTGPSDHEMPSDEIYCPCGETMPWDGDAGDLLRRIDDHCKATPVHPMPVRSEAF